MFDEMIDQHELDRELVTTEPNRADCEFCLESEKGGLICALHNTGAVARAPIRALSLAELAELTGDLCRRWRPAHTTAAIFLFAASLFAFALTIR